MPFADDAQKTAYQREYMRRRRAGQRKPEPDPAPRQPQQPDPAMLAEIETLRARVRQLEVERAQGGRPPPLPTTLEGLMARKAEAAKDRATAVRAAARTKIAGMTPEEERTVLERLEQAEKRLKARATEVKRLRAEVRYLADKAPPRMSNRLRRQILGWLHPDRAAGDQAQQKQLEKCFQEFDAIEFALPPDEIASKP